MRLKFDDCVSCVFRGKPRTCRDCDVGELYEDEDRPGVDAVFREPATRFGESVSADEFQTNGQFSPDKFAEQFGVDDEEDDTDEA